MKKIKEFIKKSLGIEELLLNEPLSTIFQLVAEYIAEPFYNVFS